MADLAELELRIKSLEVQLASQRLSEFADKSERAEGSSKRFTNQLTDQEKSAQKATRQLERMGSSFVRVARFAAIAAVAVAGVTGARTLINFEQGLVGVSKTTDLAGRDLTLLGERVIDLSLRIPIATDELLGLAQAAGQLGIRGGGNLLDFAETVARMGVATDLHGEQAALTLARLLQITGDGAENVETLGNVIVRLGNNMAATESEIAHVATRVAQATSAFEVSSGQATALGAALRAVGVEAELGGTAVGRAFFAMQDAVREGGEDLRILLDVTGRTREELSTLLATEPTTLLIDFLRGLGVAGADASVILESLNLEAVRFRNALLPLANNLHVLEEAFGLLADEEIQNNALIVESNKQFETLGSRLKILGNTVRAIALEFRDSTGTLSTWVDTLTGAIVDIFELEGVLGETTIEARILGDTIEFVSVSLAGLIALNVVASVVSWVRAFESLGAAMKAIIGLRLLTPMGGLVTLLGAGAAALLTFSDRFDELTGNAGEARIEVIKLNEELREIENLGNVLSRAFEIGNIADQEEALRRIIATVKSARREILESEGFVDVTGAFDFDESQLESLKRTLEGVDVGAFTGEALEVARGRTFDRIASEFNQALTTSAATARQVIIDALEGGLFGEVDAQFASAIRTNISRGLFEGLSEAMQEGAQLTGEEIRSIVAQAFLGVEQDFEIRLFDEDALELLDEQGTRAREILASLQQELDRLNTGQTTVPGQLTEFDKIIEQLQFELETVGLLNIEREEAIALRRLEAEAAAEGLPLEEARLKILQEQTGAVSDLFDELTRRERLANLSIDLGRALTLPLEEALLAAKTLDEALESLFRGVQAAVLRNLVTEPLAQLFTTFIRGTLIPSRYGNAIVPHRQGGIISEPSIFPMANNRVGSVAEDQPEGILPLQRTRDGRLGVASTGGGRSSYHFTNHFHGVQDMSGMQRSVRQIERMMQRRIGGST